MLIIFNTDELVWIILLCSLAEFFLEVWLSFVYICTKIFWVFGFWFSNTSRDILLVFNYKELLEGTGLFWTYQVFFPFITNSQKPEATPLCTLEKQVACSLTNSMGLSFFKNQLNFPRFGSQAYVTFLRLQQTNKQKYSCCWVVSKAQ